MLHDGNIIATLIHNIIFILLNTRVEVHKEAGRQPSMWLRPIAGRAISGMTQEEGAI